MTIPAGQQMLKCRDDYKPVVFRRDGEALSAASGFKLTGDTACSWAKADEPFGVEKLRTRIEPWLTALCQSDHLSLLLGAGVTNAARSIAAGTTPSGVSTMDFGEFKTLIDEEAKKSAQAIGRGDGNIEDQIRVANELLRGYQILASTDKMFANKAQALQSELEKILRQFAASILKSERDLVTTSKQQRERGFEYLVSFLMSFASRSGTRDRLHIFTTNYDRLVEGGAEVAGIHLLDRFVGSVAPIFRSSRLDLDLHYNPPGIRGEPRYLEGVARFTKLHGSLDWIDMDRNIRRVGIPFGAESIDPYLKLAGADTLQATRLMIYPNGAKDRETSEYPYVELFRDFAAAVCRPNHTLVIFGYSCSDEHISRIIEDMLTIPSTHLVVMGHSDPLGQIVKMYERIGRHAQITLLIGDHVGDFQSLVDHYLPKPAIDRTTFRMAELLRARWTTEQHDTNKSESEPTK
jgi:SIR2-like domain